MSDNEFSQILNHLDKGNVFQRALTLRDRFQFIRDDGSNCYVQFFNSAYWCQNQYQVTQQITQVGKYENRYDVTLLINGLPLVQIELKRRGVELKEAFHQINRYQRHSYWANDGLFNYVQLFVISNGVNTKYFANNRKQDYKQTFYWADVDNHLITQLADFSDAFLEKCHISKMISQYIVLHQTHKILMVLRPYQYYAVEAIVERVKQGRKNGYIWHTTGSGKTLTSFKAAQILTHLPKVDKVMFVVDRADLDDQTNKEFNAFNKGCVDNTNNTKSLVTQMTGDNPLIVTTIQKLNSAITNKKHKTAIMALSNKRVVFIFDECHRSQFGDTHKNIINFFSKAQLFGFTGTPIFKENSANNHLGKRTTKDLFDERLHSYLITNAINDENVLRFSVEYWGQLKQKDGSLQDEQVTGIDKKEFLESDKRSDWIIANHNRKTHNRQFTAMMCVTNKEMLMKYYDILKAKKVAGQHDLRIATIFTYDANGPDADADGSITEPNFDIKTDDPKHKHSREKLEEYVNDYNELYNTNFTIKDSNAFYSYYKNIAKRIKDREKENFDDKDRVDILLVVNMFLTGFDGKKINTLYVDKNLKQHGLIQAFSRTNRILGEKKSQGNIICFRNLKDNTDEAIKLFSDNNPIEDILMEPYEFYVEEFNQGLIHLFKLADTPDEVNSLINEDAQLAFVRAFRFLIRKLNKLTPFVDFTWADLHIDQQCFEDYKSKYLDIYQKARADKGASILEEVDFELELIHRDEINVGYILTLLGDIQQKQGKDTSKSKNTQDVLAMLGNEVQLRSKRELIEKFIQEYLPNLTPEQNLKETFIGYWYKEKRLAIHDFCQQENLNKDAVYQLMDEYHFTGKPPLREQVFAALNYKPKLMERKPVYERILKTFKDIINKYENDTGNIGVAQSSVGYDSMTLASLSYPLADSLLFFSDEVKHYKHAFEIAKFSIKLDQPYQQKLASIHHYGLNSELIGRGVINDAILQKFLSLTAEFSVKLKTADVQFYTPNHNDEDCMLLWTFDEAREGSTIIDFSLFAVMTSTSFHLTLNKAMPNAQTAKAFFQYYPKTAESLISLQDEIMQQFNKINWDSHFKITTYCAN